MMPTIEFKGVKFAVGLKFIVELTRKASEIEGKELTIEETLSEYLFNSIKFEGEKLQITPAIIDRWQTMLGLSYQMAGNEGEFNVIEIAEEKTFTYIVELVGKMAVTCVQAYTGNKQNESAKGVKKKG